MKMHEASATGNSKFTATWERGFEIKDGQSRTRGLAVWGHTAYSGG